MVHDSAEDRLRRLLEATSVGTWTWEDATRSICIDARYAMLLGFAPGTFDERLETFRSLVVEPDFEGLLASIRDALPSRRDYRARIRIRRKDDGALRWLEMRGTWLEDASGTYVGATGIVLDVTDEALRTQAVEEALERLRTAMGGVGALTWDVDLVTRTIMHDEVALHLGYVGDEAPRDLAARLALTHEDDREAMRTSMARVIEDSRDRGPLVSRIRAKDGSYRWFESRGLVARRDEAGRPARIVGASIDVTERIRFEEKLREQANVLEAILANIPVAVLMYDQERRFRFANTAMVSLLGYSPEELADPAISGRVYPEESERAKVFAHAERADGTWLLCRPRAKEGRAVESWWCNVRLPDGRILGIGRDASVEMRLRRTQKLESLGVMAGGMAHDFNNLLVGVIANANLAREDLPSGSETAALLQEIEAAAARGAKLTRQLVAYAGRHRLSLEPVDLAALASGMRELIGTLAPPGARLVYDLPPVPPLRGDPEQLRQVITSLVSNACEALAGNGGEVRVRVRSASLDAERARGANVAGGVPGPCVVLEVSDDGVGMTEEVAARAFDPFFTTKFAGRGLGLAATLGIVRSHQGTVEVVSRPGAGSTFSVFLPLSGPATTSLQAPSAGTEG